MPQPKQDACGDELVRRKFAGCFGTAGVGRLLVLSQVVLGLQLPFAVVPLLWFTTRRKHLGAHAFRFHTGIVLWCLASALILMNIWVICRLM